jgi:monoamine oxidase
MIARSGAELSLAAAVTHVAAEADGLSIRCRDGNEIKAHCAALCLPLNVMHSIIFSPPLSARKAEAASLGHGGRSVKMWLKVRGARIGTLATGGSRGLRWMFVERAGSDGTAMIVAFGLADEDFDPGNRHDVERSLACLFPEAQLVASDWHDWVDDPWARGTWVALPAESLWIADNSLWQPEGRLAFASSDYAAQSPGWFEAAIIAGEEAADALQRSSLRD